MTTQDTQQETTTQSPENPTFERKDPQGMFAEKFLAKNQNTDSLETNDEEQSNASSDNQSQETLPNSDSVGDNKVDNQSNVVSLDEESQKLLREAVQPKPTQEEPSKQYTKEELDELLQKPKVTSELFTNVFGIEEPTEQQVQQFSQFIDGVNTYNQNKLETYLDVVVKELDKRLNTSLQPLQQIQLQQEQEKAWNKFTSSYPALKEHRQVVSQAAEYLSTKPEFVKNSEEEMMKEIANAATVLLSSNGVQLNSNNLDQSSQSNQSQVTSKVPKIQGMNSGRNQETPKEEPKNLLKSFKSQKGSFRLFGNK